MKLIKRIKFFKGGAYYIELNKELKTVKEENEFIKELAKELKK